MNPERPLQKKAHARIWLVIIGFYLIVLAIILGILIGKFVL